uniref:TIR domain-containing protein n=1 Tax=Lactuca sativa TaxID=4236 RepID=A0A9R1UUT8_LACSA|nr:hypothetical protein LSAT_V11C800434670 [Lactuca sativa]
MAILTELPEEQEAAVTYDVFLSFRGKDTRLGFMDHLYQALVNENISTFLDEEEVEIGEELKPELARAIKSSRASIIVLSKNYASSTWCLDELVMILEQRRVSDHFVLPIFYSVEPTNIRKQESTFGEALFEHKQRIESEKDVEKKTQGARKLEMWTKGLTEIADLKGKDATGRFLEQRPALVLFLHMCLFTLERLGEQVNFPKVFWLSVLPFLSPVFCPFCIPL